MDHYSVSQVPVANVTGKYGRGQGTRQELTQYQLTMQQARLTVVHKHSYVTAKPPCY